MHGESCSFLEHQLSRLLNSPNPRFDKAAVAKEGEEGPCPSGLSRNHQNQEAQLSKSAGDSLKPLPGYDKTKSFFDSISCEAENIAEGGREVG